MHRVGGGGTMNRLVGEESTYRRPHCVHCQHMRLVLASAMLIAGAVHVENKEMKRRKMTYAAISGVNFKWGFEGPHC